MKTFLIYLPKIKSSLESAVETRSELIKIGINPTMFEGTYGYDAEVEFQQTNRTLRTEGISKINFDSKKIWGPGAKGVFHSHYRLWKTCIELNEPIMIFEDDVKIYRKLRLIDFNEVLILSINYEWKMSLNWKHFLEEENNLTEAQDYTSPYMPGTSGYIIKPFAAKKLVKYYDSTNSFIVSDVAMSKNLINIQIHPQLIGRSKVSEEKKSLVATEFWNL
jgi:GR25 family glycosyltransferase involved in LPS biosynthesis